MNLLGRREPGIYGVATLAQVNEKLELLATELNVKLIMMQSNHEGVIADTFHKHIDDVAGAAINPAGLSFHSVALHDAIKAMPFPVVETHLSNLACGLNSPPFDYHASRPGFDHGPGLAFLHRRFACAR